MTPDGTRTERTLGARRRRGRALLCGAWLFAVGTLGGCRFLADEFVVLDRLPPGARTAPDAPVSAVDERP